MSNYIRNKAKAIYIETMPTLTDQSAAEGTDINVIVRQLERTGMIRGAPMPGVSADTVGVPDNLRDALEQIRGINVERRKLPKPLQDMPLAQLMGLTHEQLKAIVNPPAPPPEEKKEEPK